MIFIGLLSGTVPFTLESISGPKLRRSAVGPGVNAINSLAVVV